MIKNFLLPIFFLFTLFSFAQQGTSSPYSFYGVGDVKFKGTAENRAMGGLSIFSDSIHINLQNPASYSGLKLTTFTVGGTFTASRYSTFQTEEKAQRTTVDYFAVAVPVGKFGVSFGLVPYSSVGYRISNTISHSDGEITQRYTGEGGLNRTFLGLGYQINKYLSVGADINYHFGKITTTSIRSQANVQYGTEEDNNTSMAGFGLNIGATYKQRINSKFDFTAGITFTPQVNMATDTERNIYSVQVQGELTSAAIDNIDTQYSKTSLKLPNKVTVGAGFGQNRIWMVGADLTLQESSKFGNRFNDESNVHFENSARISVGGYYIPDYASFTSYFKRVTYRAGARYENTGMVISDEQIRDYAVSAGIGFPLGGAFSNINISGEYGRRGTTKALLIAEKYTNVIISLSLNDRWFIRSKYN